MQIGRFSVPVWVTGICIGLFGVLGLVWRGKFAAIPAEPVQLPGAAVLPGPPSRERAPASAIPDPALAPPQDIASGLRRHPALFEAFLREPGIRAVIRQLEDDVPHPEGGCTRKADLRHPFTPGPPAPPTCVQPTHLPYHARPLPLLDFPRRTTEALFACWQLPQLKAYDVHVETAWDRAVPNRSLVYLSTASPRQLKLLKAMLAGPAHVFLLSCNDEPLFPRWMLDHPRVLRLFAAHIPFEERHPKLVPIPLGIKKEWVASLPREQRLAAAAVPTQLTFSKFAVRGTAVRIKRRMQAVHALQALGWGSLKTMNKKVAPGEFYAQLRQSKFVISPPGNGLDAYRTWEALAMGRPPVILARQLHEAALFEGLPVVPVESWRHLNGSELQRLWPAYRTRRFNANKLLRVWWLAHIVVHCLRTP